MLPLGPAFSLPLPRRPVPGLRPSPSPLWAFGWTTTPSVWRWVSGLVLSLCRPHSCHHCGVQVDAGATHGLSCRYSEGRHHRHSSINDLILRALSSMPHPFAPRTCRPPSLGRQAPRRGHDGPVEGVASLLLWDATCPDTFAPSYLAAATSEAGAVANLAEERKLAKYSSFCLEPPLVTPIAIETSGALGRRTLVLFEGAWPPPPAVLWRA